jgi:Flp pilus assembly pilin Flp
MFRGIVRWLIDDGGQDLIEYAVLTGIIAVGGLLVFIVTALSMGFHYQLWEDLQQLAWEPSPPCGC